MDKKILIIIGTRPEAIKLAPLYYELKKKKKIKCEICLTSQHKSLLKNMIKLFKLRPKFDLNVMQNNQDLTKLFQKILNGLTKINNKFEPDILIVQGDTTTALASSFFASMNKIKLIHVEAGLRSFDNQSPWPEEINRKLISQISNLNICPTNRDFLNLEKENIKNKIVLGNTIVDSVDYIKKKVIKNRIQIYHNKFKKFLNSKNKIFCTIHRRENFGKNLKSILYAIKYLAEQKKLSFFIPVHPNPNVKKIVYKILRKTKNIILSNPISYDESIYLIEKSDLIMSDSGGIQEESSILKKEIIILRDKTERQDILKKFGVIVGANQNKIIEKTSKMIKKPKNIKNVPSPFGKVGLTKKIAKEILK